MQEQERVANEEAEKRLKAALTAKREPVSTSSRTAPSGGATQSVAETAGEAKPVATEGGAVEDVSMELDQSVSTAATLSQGVVFFFPHL
jgi:THO complex subunit 2